MNEQLYEDTVDLVRMSVFTGGKEVRETTTLDALRQCDIPTLVAWANDDDLQVLTVASTNIGTHRTYQKRFKRAEAEGGE